MCEYLLETDHVTQTLVCDQQLKVARENEMPVEQASNFQMAHTEFRLTWLTEEEI